VIFVNHIIIEDRKMTQYTLKAPSKLTGTVNLPASKSISNRALIISALSGNVVLPQNLSDCDDTNVIVKALRDMPYEIDIMAAGTAMRFMTAYLSVNEGEHVLTGTERMKHRPIKILVDALRYLGADIEYVGEEGFPPLRIRGKKLEGGQLDIPGNVSSQFISALLMIGPVLEKGLELNLTGNIISRPYIDLTLHTMHDFGAKVEWKDINTIKAEPCGYIQRD
jgi:3-phosphoshikimate 1-carboxyvinyltransferase